MIGSPQRLRTACRLAILSLAAAGAASPGQTPAETAQGGPGSRPAMLAGAEAFNYVLGTQTVSPRYQFTDQPKLVETARAILDMGSNTIKFSLRREHWGDAGLRRDEPSIRVLADVVRHQAYRRVLDMPFAHILLWAYALAEPQWQDGLSAAERDQEYREIYALTRYLLTAYSGTGKTFYLGHWEGDWLLLGGFDPKKEPSPIRLAGFTDWLNARQQAVDDARRDTPHHAVQVFHYTEVNLVRKALTGEPCLTNDVLPRIRVDYVSYSCYDSLQGDIRKNLRECLDHIQSKLPPRPDIPGKRVFIGEYGFPLEVVKTPPQQDLRSRQVMRAGLEWGCPMVLYWEMYCNEVSQKTGRSRGFWLIDDQNHKQPVYRTHQQFYQQAHQYVRQVQAQTGRLPTPEEFRRQAIEWLKD